MGFRAGFANWAGRDEEEEGKGKGNGEKGEGKRKEEEGRERGKRGEGKGRVEKKEKGKGKKIKIESWAEGPAKPPAGERRRRMSEARQRPCAFAERSDLHAAIQKCFFILAVLLELRCGSKISEQSYVFLSIFEIFVFHTISLKINVFVIILRQGSDFWAGLRPRSCASSYRRFGDSRPTPILDHFIRAASHRMRSSPKSHQNQRRFHATRNSPPVLLKNERGFKRTFSNFLVFLLPRTLPRSSDPLIFRFTGKSDGFTCCHVRLQAKPVRFTHVQVRQNPIPHTRPGELSLQHILHGYVLLSSCQTYLAGAGRRSSSSLL